MDDWDVFAIAGPSGVGKTQISYPLARHFNVAISEIDDFFCVAETLTTPAEQPAIHYWRTHPEAVNYPPQRIVELQLDVSRSMSPAIASVIENHIETRMPVILDGDFILPELIVEYSDRVKAVFLYEDDEEQIVKNFLLREPDEGTQRKRAHVSWLFGQWLREECERHGLSAIPSRPWKTVVERTLAAIAT